MNNKLFQTSSEEVVGFKILLQKKFPTKKREKLIKLKTEKQKRGSSKANYYVSREIF